MAKKAPKTVKASKTEKFQPIGPVSKMVSMT